MRVTRKDYVPFLRMSKANQQIHVPAFVKVKKEKNAEWKSHLFKDFSSGKMNEKFQWSPKVNT